MEAGGGTAGFGEWFKYDGVRKGIREDGAWGIGGGGVSRSEGNGRREGNGWGDDCCTGKRVKEDGDIHGLCPTPRRLRSPADDLRGAVPCLPPFGHERASTNITVIEVVRRD